MTETLTIDRSQEYDRREVERKLAQICDGLRRTIPARFRAASLENWRATRDDQRDALTKARVIAADRQMLATRNLLFVGTVGTGKDHMAIGLLKCAAKAGLSARWYAGKDIYARIADSYRQDAHESPREIYEELNR